MIKKEDMIFEEKKLQKTRRLIDEEVKKSEDRLLEGFEEFDYDDDYKDEFMKAALIDRYKQRIRNLKQIRPNPYFARVDFIEKGTEKRDAFYLGKETVTDMKTLEQVVVDWRAPIADLYYEGRLGEAAYDCPDGRIEGEIKLKRQYVFEDEALKDVMDIDITTNDEMLQPFLSANSDTRLKNIVSTIQAEQNKIIRATMWKPLIVQGVAGSGKTTIALHRIAYLIYNCGKDFFPEEFLIIAPNKFFLNYISNVLPDLGVDRVGQMTYEEIAFKVIENEFKIEDPNEKLSFIIKNNKSPKEKEYARILEEATFFKSTIRFKNCLDDYIYEVEKRFLPDNDFVVFDITFMTKEEIATLFYREYAYLPLVRRIEEIKKHMLNKLTNKQAELINEFEEEAKFNISKVRFENDIIEIQRAQIREIYDERDRKIKQISKDEKKYVNDYFKENKVLDPLGYYKDFLNNYFASIAGNRVSKENIDFIIKNFSSMQRKGMIEMEDLAPLMYLKAMIHGIKFKFDLKHIVIDEAQDFSEFQFYVFKKIVKSNSLTILGDLAQGIYGFRGTHNWKKTMDIVFEGDTDLQYLTLQKTYRTTEEIMNVANRVISKIQDSLQCPLGEPVMKNGAPVTIKQVESEDEMISKIKYRIGEFKKYNLKNIAIIGKTIEDCENLMAMLNDDSIHMISSKDSTYDGGVSIVPSYLSKGLEFDAVIITDCNDDNYSMTETDVKLLYVCITRAMNTLDIYSVKPVTKLLA